MPVESMRAINTFAAAALIAVGCSVLAQSGATPTTVSSKEWPTYGHDPGGMRFSPLTQITPANVSRLDVAWTYHMKPAAVPSATPAPAPEGRGRGRGG